MFKKINLKISMFEIVFSSLGSYVIYFSMGYDIHESYVNILIVMIILNVIKDYIDL